MSSDYADEIFEQIDIPSRFADLRAVVAIAIASGWTAIPGKGVMLVSEDGTQINLPRSSHLRLSVFRHHVNSIVRHRVVSPGGGLPGAPLGILITEIVARLKLDHDHARILTDLIPQRKQVETVEPVPAEEADTTPAEPTVETVPEEEIVFPVRHLVSEEPWSAHGRRRKAGTEVYPSDAVMQRNWSDGTHDFVCRFDGCDWHNDVPRAVAGHYGSKHMRGNGMSPQPAADGVDPAWDPPVRKRRIAKLRGEIDAAMIAAFAAGVVADAEWIATWIVDHRVDPEVPSTHTGNGEYNAEGEWIEIPMTAEEILERMAAMLERHTGRSKTMRATIDSQDQVIQQYQRERDDAEARATRAEGNLHALRDLLNEDDGTV